MKAKVCPCGTALRNTNALSKGYKYKVENLVLGCGFQVVAFCLWSLYEEQAELARLGLGLSNLSSEKTIWVAYSFFVCQLQRNLDYSPSSVPCQSPGRLWSRVGNTITRIDSFSPRTDDLEKENLPVRWQNYLGGLGLWRTVRDHENL